MFEKQLKFQMKFGIDDSEAMQKIKATAKQFQTELNNALKGVFSGPGGGGGGGGTTGMSSGLNQFYKQMAAQQKNADNAMRNYTKEQTKLTRDLIKEENHRYKVLQDQEKMSKNKNRDLQEELRIKKELKTTDEQIARIQGAIGSKKTSFDAAQRAASGQTMPVFITNECIKICEALGGGKGGEGGGEGGGGAGGFNWKKLMSIQGVQSLMGMAAIMGAAGVVKDYGGLQVGRQSAIGGATQAMAGNQLGELYGGNVITGMAFQQERQRAMETAEKKRQTDMVSDTFLSPKSWMGTAATAAGFVTGGSHTQLGRWLYGKGDEYASSLQAQQMAGKGETFQQSLQAQQQQEQDKMLAAQYYQDRYGSDLQRQRTMGLSDEQLYGGRGIMQRAQKQGFTGDMALQMGESIQAAGGSTRAMSGNAILALQAQRGMGMTNAGSVLGQISAGAGSAEASERTFKRILTEGMKDGLDKSEAVEELRRFSQMTAEVVSKTGAVSEADVQRTIENFARFQAGGVPTLREQEGAKEAYQEYQGFSAATAGRGGAMQYAAMTKSGLTGKLDPRAIGGLMELPEEDVTADNPFIQAMASQAGMKPEDMVRQVINSKRSGVAATGGVNPEWQRTLSRAGINKEMSFTDLEKLKTTNPEAYNAYIEIEKSQSNISQYTSAQKRSAGVRGLMSMGDVTAGAPLPSTAPADQKLGEPTGRMGDEATRALAASSQKALENFREFKDVLVPTADAVNKVTTALKGVIDVVKQTPDLDKAAALQGSTQNIPQSTPATGAPTQPQAGKSKPGTK